MKSGLESLLDGTGILYRLFLAAICYKVSPDITLLLVLFYLINFGLTFYYIRLREKEDKEFLELAHNAIKKATEEYERNKNNTE